jgi:hypothetical protein
MLSYSKSSDTFRPSTRGKQDSETKLKEGHLLH